MWKKLLMASASMVLGASCVVASEVNNDTCPMRVLGVKTISGTFLGNECADNCFSSIQLENGTTVSMMCGEDDSATFWGMKPGVPVEATYKIMQFVYNPLQIEGEEICMRSEVCLNGRILGNQGRKQTAGKLMEIVGYANVYAAGEESLFIITDKQGNIIVDSDDYGKVPERLDECFSVSSVELHKIKVSGKFKEKEDGSLFISDYSELTCTLVED